MFDLAKNNQFMGSRVNLKIHVKEPWMCLIYKNLKTLTLKRNYIVSWEPEGHYGNWKMFRWEPEGRYCCTKSIWFSTEHLWSTITPFWLSTDNIHSPVYSLKKSMAILLVLNRDKNYHIFHFHHFRLNVCINVYNGPIDKEKCCFVW